LAIRKTRHDVLETGITINNWGKLLGDTAAVTAPLDRLLHHAQAACLDHPAVESLRQLGDGQCGLALRIERRIRLGKPMPAASRQLKSSR
jgi:hypothetical protein